MDHGDLRNFIALAETLHFARAAARVHISPSALTRAIQRLESEVGHPLFARDRRHVKLTPAGRTFLTFAEGVLADWETCRATLQTRGDVVEGTLSIYSSITAVYTILSSVLRPFRNRYPGVQVNLSTGAAADAIGRVRDGLADCAVAAMPETLPAAISFLNLTTTALVCIAPVGFRHIPRFGPDGGVDWPHTPVIMPDRDAARTMQQKWFASQGITPSIFAEVSGNEAIIAMVSLGFGVGIVPEIVLNQSPLRENVQILHHPSPLPPYAIGVVVATRRETDPLIAAFCEVARETAVGSD
jgi:LysR family transcriptional regulator, positive regulator for ilvC